MLSVVVSEPVIVPGATGTKLIDSVQVVLGASVAAVDIPESCGQVEPLPY